MKVFPFEPKNLIIDYISFNIQGLFNQKQVETISTYLSQNLEFNSTFALEADGKQETVFYKYQVFLERTHTLTFSGTVSK